MTSAGSPGRQYKKKAQVERQGKVTLTGFDLQGVGVFLLDGMGEVEACVTAVVGLRILQHNVGEVQVTVLALGDALVLVDGLHGCEREEGIQKQKPRACRVPNTSVWKPPRVCWLALGGHDTPTAEAGTRQRPWSPRRAAECQPALVFAAKHETLHKENAGNSKEDARLPPHPSHRCTGPSRANSVNTPSLHPSGVHAAGQ